MDISEREPRKQFIEVAGKRMAYVDEGTGSPIVLLHGNPTSSYLWRNIIPALTACGRCIAPDLIGMGDSEKLVPSGPERYRFVEHRAFLDALLEALGVATDVIFVLHDWGSALGFDWANRHREAVSGIAYMESIVQPLPSWDEWPDAARNIFQAMRSPAGEALILERNVFIERILPGSVLRSLSPAEMETYRRPFTRAGEDRRVMLTWPREIPLLGEPADVVAIVADYAAWMAGNTLPKLFVNAEPGSILIGAQREFCRTWKNQSEVTVRGSHFIQEDSPFEIAQAISDWLERTRGQGLRPTRRLNFAPDRRGSPDGAQNFNIMTEYERRVADRRALLGRALARFVETTRRFPDVHAVYVFGSLARDDVGAHSDLDLLVVRETTRRGPMRGEDLAIAALLGIDYDLLVLTPAEYAARGAASTFWRDVIAEAKLVYAA